MNWHRTGGLPENLGHYFPAEGGVLNLVAAGKNAFFHYISQSVSSIHKVPV
jgi:hypothetical protein